MMLYPQPSYIYEQKLERIATEMEEMILDAVLTALERLNRQNQRIRETEEKLSSDKMRF